MKRVKILYASSDCDSEEYSKFITALEGTPWTDVSPEDEQLLVRNRHLIPKGQYDHVIVLRAEDRVPTIVEEVLQRVKTIEARRKELKAAAAARKAARAANRKMKDAEKKRAQLEALKRELGVV